MAAKTNLPVGSRLLRPVTPTTILTTDERRQRIEVLGQCINGYVQFMCQTGNLTNTSGEVMEKGIIAFYEQMVLLESQLGRIHDDLKLE